MTEPLIEAVNVAKDLGSGAAKVAALKGVSLALTGGELTLLMGPSGSGKTTLLSILGCMLTPNEGSVRVRGNPTDGAGPEELALLRREHVGFVFQSFHRLIQQRRRPLTLKQDIGLLGLGRFGTKT